NIRIDANQSWSLEQAKTYLSKLQPYQIEYCEEPLIKPTVESLQILNEDCTVPVALDESVFTSFELSQSFELVPVIISKPMIWGYKILSGKTDIITSHTYPKLVFTTSLESSIGRLMTATLATGLGNPDLAHGLNTGRMLTNDIWNDEQFIKNGRFRLPDAKNLKKLMDTKLSHLNLQSIAI